jgi:hypothetical protein
MKIGKIRLHPKAQSHAPHHRVSALLPLAIISWRPNRAFADHGHARQGIVIGPYNQLKGPNDALCGQTEGLRSPISKWSTGHFIDRLTKLGGPQWRRSGWTHHMLRVVCICSVFIASLATGQTTWAQQGLQENTGPLPPPPPSAAPFVQSAPFLAFNRIEDQNGSVRIAFKGVGPGGAKIELRDVIVAPDASIRFDPIKGQVVIDTRSGEGLVKTGDLSATLETTKVASIAANGRIEVQNQGDVPLVLMIYVVEGR